MLLELAKLASVDKASNDILDIKRLLQVIANNTTQLICGIQWLFWFLYSDLRVGDS